MFRVFRAVPIIIIIALFLGVLLSAGEKAEARPPCWAGEIVRFEMSCHYASYDCYHDSGYYYQRFSRTGKIADFNLFWPGGKVTQTVLKNELEVTVKYPQYGLTIKIYFRFACNANACIPLSYSGFVEVEYTGVGITTACSMLNDWYYYGEGGVEPRSESLGQEGETKSLVDFVNKIVAGLINQNQN